MAGWFHWHGLWSGDVWVEAHRRLYDVELFHAGKSWAGCDSECMFVLNRLDSVFVVYHQHQLCLLRWA